MIYQATDVVNYAQGEMAMFSTYLAWSMLNAGVPYWAAFVATLALAFAGGLLIQRIVIRPVERAPVLTIVIVGGTSLSGGVGSMWRTAVGLGIIATISNGFNILNIDPDYQNIVKGAITELMTTHPTAVEVALGVVNANLIRYAQASLERGAAGIFLSVPASTESLTLEQYERFMRPFDLQLLQAIAGRGECHVLHAHGERLYLDRLLDYPVQALSWADLNGGPAIAQMRQRSPLTLMAGLDHVKLVESSAGLVRGQVRRALAEAGPTRFILAPGCSLPTYAYPPLIRAAREESAKG